MDGAGVAVVIDRGRLPVPRIDVRLCCRGFDAACAVFKDLVRIVADAANDIDVSAAMRTPVRVKRVITLS
jgi:hypothetical protein